jgi:predicted dehydrogenase
MIRLGVIGVGGRGEIAALAHQPEQGVQVVAGADVQAPALQAFAETYGPDAFVTDDYRALLAQPDIDAVIITSPDFLHEEHAVAALQAGKDIYLEKPMAITIEGCDRVLQAAVDAKRKLYMGHNLRHFTMVRKLKEIIDSGIIGEPKAVWCRHFISFGGDAYFKDWHADRSKTTSMLLQMGSHDFDVLHYLCGSPARAVTAMGGLTLYDRITDRHGPNERGDATVNLDNWPPLSQTGMNPVIDVEDLSMVLMEMRNGIFASYQQCHYTPDTWRNYTIIGTQGRVENYGDLPGECIIKVWNRRSFYNPHGDIQYHLQPETGSFGGADQATVEEFLRFLREGGPTVTSPLDARYSVAVGCLATASLRSNGMPQTIPAVPKDVEAYFSGNAETNAPR